MLSVEIKGSLHARLAELITSRPASRLQVRELNARNSNILVGKKARSFYRNLGEIPW